MYTSIDPFKDADIVECAHCKHIQYEFHVNDDKMAWKCRNCQLVNESGKVHILAKTARFKSKYSI